jgi:hypothetical protein
MSTDSVYGSHGDRTDAHVENERSAASSGFGYPEPTRTLRFNLDGIGFEIRDAISSWSDADDGTLYCARCKQFLTLVAPNMLHRQIMAVCACRSSFVIPLDSRDAAHIELMCPISEEDAQIAEKFNSEIARLTAAVSPKRGAR